MSGVWRQVGRHPIHGDAVPCQIFEDFVEVAKRKPKMRVVLPTPAIMRLQFRRSEQFHRKAKPSGRYRRFQAATSTMVSAPIPSEETKLFHTAMLDGSTISLALA